MMRDQTMSACKHDELPIVAWVCFDKFPIYTMNMCVTQERVGEKYSSRFFWFRESEIDGKELNSARSLSLFVNESIYGQ
jgi:hypothetical protein